MGTQTRSSGMAGMKQPRKSNTTIIAHMVSQPGMPVEAMAPARSCGMRLRVMNAPSAVAPVSTVKHMVMKRAEELRLSIKLFQVILRRSRARIRARGRTPLPVGLRWGV